MGSGEFLFRVLNPPEKGEGEYFLNSNITNLIMDVNTFLFSKYNYMVYDAKLVNLLLRGSADNVKPLKVDRQIEKAINGLDKKIKTENLILLRGDVNKNIPLLTMYNNYSSERDSEAHRKLLHISFDKLEGERQEADKKVSKEFKIHVANFDVNEMKIYNHINDLVISERDNDTNKTIEVNNDFNSAIKDYQIKGVDLIDSYHLVELGNNERSIYLDPKMMIGDHDPNNNQIYTERKMEKASLYHINTIEKRDILGRAVKYDVAKKIIIEKPSMWGLKITPRDMELLIKTIRGVNEDALKRGRPPIPINIFKLLEHQGEIVTGMDIVIVEVKQSGKENKIVNLEKTKIKEATRNKKEDVKISSGIILSEREKNSFLYRSLMLESAEKAIDSGKLYDYGFIGNIEDHFPESLLGKDLINGSKIENIGKILDKYKYGAIEDPLTGKMVSNYFGEHDIDLQGIINNKIISGISEDLEGRIIKDYLKGNGEDLQGSVNKVISGILDDEFIGSLLKNEIGMKDIKDKYGILMKDQFVAEKGFRSYLMKKIFSGNRLDKISILENLLMGSEKSILEKMTILTKDPILAKRVMETPALMEKLFEVEKADKDSKIEILSPKAFHDLRQAEMLEDPEGERVNLHDATLNIFGDGGKDGVEKVPKESVIENKTPIIPPAIGVESPPDLWDDADIHNPSIDFNEEDPSKEKDVPNRWYDNPKTPVQNVLEMIVEMKNRGQGINYPANTTADMISHTLQNWVKNNVNKNPSEYKDIANFVDAVMDSTMNDVCIRRERVKKDTIVNYHKDFQEEGSWMDKEWTGSDQPPESEGVGRWINVDLTKPSGATAEQLDRTFAKNGGRLAGLGQACIDAEKKYGVNAYYIASHACWESTWGKSQIAKDKNNLFGYGAYDWSPYESAWTFPSKADCIDTVMKNVAREYLNPNGKYYGGSPTLKGMNKRYATDMNWANGISTIMKQFAEGKNPPDSLLNGFTVQPYSAWYRYQEPQDEVDLEKQYDPNTDDPNYALHSPNNMNVNDKSSVSVKRFSKLDGQIKYRAKVNGTITDPAIVTRFVDRFDRSDLGIGYAVNPASWAYNDPSKGWRIEEGKAKTNSSSFLTGWFISKYECMIKAKCRVKKFPADGNLIPNGKNIMVYDNSFLGYSGNDGHFHFNENDSGMRANGWYEWIGWGGQSAVTGSIQAGQVASAEWQKTVNVGKMGGFATFRFLIWCDDADNGAVFSVQNNNGTISDTQKGYGNGYPFTGEHAGDNMREVRLSLSPGENTIKVSIHNSGVSVLMLDEVQVFETGYQETYPVGGMSYYSSALHAGSFPEGNLNLGGGSPDYETYSKGYVNPENDSETFDIIIPSLQPSAPGVETRHDFYFAFLQDNPSFMDYCTIDDFTIIETRTSTGGTSFLNFYIDGQLQQETFYTGKRWNHYEFDIKAGNHEYKWEFTQKDDMKTDYALIDDIEIVNWEAKIEQYWDCPADTGGELIDRVIDSLKDKAKPKQPDPPQGSKIWLMT